MKGARLEDALKRVRLAVRVASRGAQIPWESTSLESDVFLFPASTSKLSEAELEAEFQREIATWNRIKGSWQADDWVGYLRDYPSGKFNEIALNRLNNLLRAEELGQSSAKPTVVAIATTTSIPVSSVPAEPPASPPSTGPQLEIAPGLPVPQLMRPSPNPSSAGTYAINRRYSVGDEVTYAESDPIFGVKRPDRVQHVTRVEENADVVEFNDGMYIWDTLGNQLKTEKGAFEPRIQHVPAELQIGRKWTTRFRASGPGYLNETYFDYKVVARERVRVPAGEFDAFRLEAEGWNVTNGTRMTIRSWVVPGLNFNLKSEFIGNPRYSAARYGEVREMISCKQMRWTVA